MSRVEKIEFEIQRMSSEELSQFRKWFWHFDAEAWDRQIVTDIQAGKLDAMAKQALLDHQNGRSTEL